MNRNSFQKTRIVGVEDGSFQKNVTKKALLVAVLVTGSKIEQAKAFMITVDGLDATERLSANIRDWAFDALLLSGISFAGFNLIDPMEVFEAFGKPIIIVSRTKPNNETVKRALRMHFEDWEMRWAIFEKLGPVHKTVTPFGKQPIYLETIKADVEWASQLVRALAFWGRLPEPLRVARLIARGLS
jgi:endonuclease V-like protein UPF0215 family